MYETLLLATLGLTGLLGTVAAYFGLKAFFRGKDGSFLFAATGFGLVSSATVLGAVGCVFLNIYDVTVHIGQSAAVAAGLFSIIYSISRVKGTPVDRVVPQSIPQRTYHRHQPATTEPGLSKP